MVLRTALPLVFHSLCSVCHRSRSHSAWFAALFAREWHRLAGQGCAVRRTGSGPELRALNCGTPMARHRLAVTFASLTLALLTMVGSSKEVEAAGCCVCACSTAASTCEDTGRGCWRLSGLSGWVLLPLLRRGRFHLRHGLRGAVHQPCPDQHPHMDTDQHGDFHHPDSHTNKHTRAITDAGRHPCIDPDQHGNQHPDRDSYADAVADQDTNRNEHANANTDSNRDSRRRCRSLPGLPKDRLPHE